MPRYPEAQDLALTGAEGPRQVAPTTRERDSTRPFQGEHDQRCQRGRDRWRGEAPASGPKRDESRSAGLAPEGILVYVERGEGRRPRPFRTGSTLPPKSAARGKARAGRRQEHKTSNQNSIVSRRTLKQNRSGTRSRGEVPQLSRIWPSSVSVTTCQGMNFPLS